MLAPYNWHATTKQAYLAYNNYYYYQQQPLIFLGHYCRAGQRIMCILPF